MKPEPELAIKHGFRGVSRFIDAPYTELRIPDSAHWVQNEAVAEVNEALLRFLGDEIRQSSRSSEQV